MTMPLLDNCCFCIGLRTGSLIIGWIGLMIFIIDLVHSIDLYSTYLKEKHSIPNDSGSNTEEMRKMSHFLGISVIGILMNAALIYAALKNLKLMLLPWLITVAAFGAFLIFYSIFTQKTFFNCDIDDVTQFVIFLLMAFLWLRVLSFYTKFKDDYDFDLERQNGDLLMRVFPDAPTKVDSPPPEYGELLNTN